MQLSFNKSIDGSIIVELKGEKGNEDFSYSRMIKEMYDDKSVENAEIKGDFSEKEIESIEKLVEELRAAIIDANNIDEGISMAI